MLSLGIMPHPKGVNDIVTATTQQGDNGGGGIKKYIKMCDVIFERLLIRWRKCRSFGYG